MEHGKAAQLEKANPYQDLHEGRNLKKEEKQAYAKRVAAQDLVPTWDMFDVRGAAEPNSWCVPKLWSYNDLRPYLLEAGDLISAKHAERRGLMLQNPGLPKNLYGITRSIEGGYQLMLPREPVVPHRHSWTAFRFYIEGKSGFTDIEGERFYMKPGDVVVQPPGLWHSHGNDGDDPVIWFDGLDSGLVNALEATFIHSYTEDTYPTRARPGDSLTRYGQNVVPVDYAGTESDFPLQHYPYDRTRAVLENIKAGGNLDHYHGAKVRYINPVSGGHGTTTIAQFMQLLPDGFATSPYRSTDATIFIVVEGRGETIVGNTELRWQQWDTFVVPSWKWYRHTATHGDAVLFSCSDRAAQQRLGLWWEERGNDSSN